MQRLAFAILEKAKCSYTNNSYESNACEYQDYIYPDLILKSFHKTALDKLTALKIEINKITDPDIKNFFWFVLTSILRSSSYVCTAQCQYVLPKKTKTNVLDPFYAYFTKINEIFDDILTVNNLIDSNSRAQIFNEDSRKITSIPDNWGDLVITSPPYANNYDYADVMRLEMLFWNDLNSWKNLHNDVVAGLVRSCTQHIGNLKKDIAKYLNSPLLAPIKEELEEKYFLLEKERKSHGGKKNYHVMIVMYFYDLAQVFQSLFRVTKSSAKMCFVVGDSAPYGIYIPVDIWLGKLAQNAGFARFKFEKLRDRNVKWKNRKHDVPLSEGRLWISKT